VITLENVVATAPGTQLMILKGVSCAINAGEVVGVDY
jgi:ABC-type protease/lipase transport system fused ATPase/permease subunit